MSVNYDKEFSRIDNFFNNISKYHFNEKAIFSIDSRKPSIFNKIYKTYDINIFNSTDINLATKDELFKLK